MRSVRFAGLPAMLQPALPALDRLGWGGLPGLPVLGLSDSCCRLICSPCCSQASCCTWRSVVSGLQQERGPQRMPPK